MCNFVITRLLFALLTLTMNDVCISTSFCTYIMENPLHSGLSKGVKKKYNDSMFIGLQFFLVVSHISEIHSTPLSLGLAMTTLRIRKRG